MKSFVDFADLRIGPSGLLYHAGQEVTLPKAFELIKGTKRLDRAPVGEPPVFLITTPPPFRTNDAEAEALNLKARETFAALQKEGEAAGVTIQKIW